jgi:hypothetical protein
VRVPATLAVFWTTISALIVLFGPANVDVPGCTHLVEPPTGCIALLAAANDHAWWTLTLPLLMLIVGGYVIVAITAIRALRRRRSAAADRALGDPGRTPGDLG